MANKATIRIGIRNFRSVRSADLDLKPITVLTGANGAGKSSFMYAIMALRNILLNANQPADNFFNLGFVNLGGVKEVVTNKETNQSIVLGIHFSEGPNESTYAATIGPNSALRLNVKRPYALDLRVGVSFPYPLVQNVSQEVLWKDQRFRFSFNGVGLNIVPIDGATPPEFIAKELQAPAVVPIMIPQAADYVDVRRGFFRNTYAPLNNTSNGEDGVASLLATDRDLEARVSVILDKMLNKSFATRHTALGAANFYLQTTDRNTGFVCDLVNEGFGVNQLVYVLAKVFQKNKWLVCIEEPETHLHPEALTKLAEQFLNITRREKKWLLISSHSEHFVVALLNLIAQGKASPEDIGIHFIAKDENNFTRIAEQGINDKGQIEGGLKSFYEPNIRALEEFLGPEPREQNANPPK